MNLMKKWFCGCLRVCYISLDYKLIVRPLWGSVRNASRGIIPVLLIPGLLH